MTIDAEDVRVAVDRLRLSWRWLELMVEPSRVTGSTRAITDTQAEVLEARGRSDRAYRDWNLRRGMSALPPAPTPASIEVIDAQVAVEGYVDRVIRLCVSGSKLPRPPRRVPARLAWLAAERLWTATTDGVVWTVDGVLERLTAMLLAAVHADLVRADRAARHVARVVDEAVKVVRARCPACRRRSLQLDHEDVDPRRWVVRCVSASCVCTGVGCGCLQRYRVEGRRHAWPQGALRSGYGLAMAVAVRDAVDEQDLAQAGRTREVRSTVHGHGGWPERRRAT